MASFLERTRAGISWALAAGIPPSDVARFAGTSVVMLERVYHHLLSTSTDAARERLDTFAARVGHEWPRQKGDRHRDAPESL